MNLWQDLYYTAKDVAETCAFICTPILAFLAWRGLNQIKVTRGIAKMQATRESFRIATERCDHYASAIVPLMDAFYENKKKDKYTALFEAKVTEEEEGSIKVESKQLGDIQKEIHNDGGDAIKLLNALEGFSMYFTCGIADEKIAYRSIAPSYCQVVRRLCPYLVPINKIEKVFGHTLKLYTTWRDRMVQEESAEKIRELAKKASYEIKGIKTINL